MKKYPVQKCIRSQHQAKSLSMLQGVIIRLCLRDPVACVSPFEQHISQGLSVLEGCMTISATPGQRDRKSTILT